MEEMNKVDQNSSPPSNSSSEISMAQMIMEHLEKSRESAHHIRAVLDELRASKDQDIIHHDDHDDGYFCKVLDEQSMVILSTLSSALSMLNNSSDYFQGISTKPNKLARTDSNNKNPTSKDRRGCYKRRRNGQSVTVDTINLTDDGYAWRKYGQKEILNAKHPRNYYRCTHKIDQGCQATKQVQQISENPTKYRIIYHGYHTCKNLLLKSPSILPLQDSSFLLSFETNNYSPSKQALNPNFLFSPSSLPTVHDQDHDHVHQMVKNEFGSAKQEEIIPSSSLPYDHHGTHNHHHYHHSSSSSSSYDPPITAISSTPVSDHGDVISSAETYSTASPHDMEEDYAFIMADSIDFGQVFQDLYT